MYYAITYVMYFIFIIYFKIRK